MNFNFKINVKMAVVMNKDIKEVQKNIQLRFMDGCRFIASSLNRLASSLDDDQCKKLRDFYKGEEILKLMKSKGTGKATTEEYILEQPEHERYQ